MVMQRKDSGGIFKDFFGGQKYGLRNESKDVIIDFFTTTYDLILMNTWFKKRDSHLMT